MMKPMNMKRLSLAAIAAAWMLIALHGPPAAAGSAYLGVSFKWQASDECSSRSPAFTVSGVPGGTKYLRFKMVDLNVPDFPHGGGTVPYTGSGSIPAGAFSYSGPCPPYGRHNYKWTVEALDAAGNTLATGTAVRPFPPN